MQSVAGRARAPALVGGAVRDAWLRERRAPRVADLDVTVQSGALDIARRVATRLGGAFVPLDPERGAARVLARGGCLDVTDWRAATLEGDLAARDFTVNALAVPVGELLRRGRARVIDPTGGLDDLRARRLRTHDMRVLAEDPLRTLRGARAPRVRLARAGRNGPGVVSPALPHRLGPDGGRRLPQHRSGRFLQARDAGHYAALAGSGGRLAAAYVLPRSGGPLFGSAAVHVSLLTEP